MTESQQRVGRRGFLGTLGRGAGAIAVLAAGGATWRAVDQGVFTTEHGQAYAAWDGWNPPGDDVLNLVRAAVLAASAHNSQPWLFRVTPTRIDLFADPGRNIGTIDPLRREQHMSLGCALENLVIAAGPNGKAPTVALMPNPADQTHMARVDLRETPAATSALFEAIPNRHTNRAAYDTGRPVSQDTLD
ncbi:MAG: Acg family FMN-binding oxidoreductase, partial [Stackebrandtia sp.]